MKRKLLNMVDILVVVNELQSLAAQKLLGINKNKIAIIPNIVEQQYFQDKALIPKDLIGLENYILCTGNVCKRKNQLNLANAAISAGFPLLIIGDVLHGEEKYAEDLSKAIKNKANIQWIKGVNPGSPLLVSAYANCIAFALPSIMEQQPISALEAAAAGKPLLLADKPYAYQKYFRNACLVNPGSEKSIHDGLIKIVKYPTSYLPEKKYLIECTGEKVGQAYKNVYDLAVKSIREIEM